MAINPFHPSFGVTPPRIAADMIQSAGHGRVDCTLPYLQDYLREHPAATGR